MRSQLSTRAKVAFDLCKASLTSDGLTGAGVTFTGFESILAIVATNTPSTSVAVLTCSFQKAILYDVSSDNASSDWSAFDSDCYVTSTYAASTNTYLGVIDIKIPSSDSSGCIRANVLTPGEGLTIDGISVTYVLYGGSDQYPSTDYTYSTWEE